MKRLKILKSKSFILIVSMVAIVLGYVFLARNSISLAPALLVLGYCVLVPVALLWGE